MLYPCHVVRMLKPFINNRFFTEESITDYLLMKLEMRGLIVKKISKREEARIGCDFIVENTIAVQAKMLRKGKYSIDYKQQKTIFMEYCRSNDLIGFYLFYNPNEDEVITCTRLENIDINKKGNKIKEFIDEIYSIRKKRTS